MPLQQLAIGPAVASDGSTPTARGGRSGEAVVQELHGRYYEATFRKNVYTAYVTAVSLTTAGTTMTGIQVWNGSSTSGGVNLNILKVGGIVTVTSASQTGVLLGTGAGQTAAPTAQVAATRVSNNFLGGPSPAATATNTATFTAAPTAMMNLLHNTAAIGTTGVDTGFQLDLEGSLIVPPTYYVAFIALGAAGAASSNHLNVTWEEIPV